MKRVLIFILLFISVLMLNITAGSINNVSLDEAAATRNDSALHFIKRFYSLYLSEDCNEDSLIAICMTKQMQEKTKRIINTVGFSPIIKAQDVSDEMRSTIRFSHLKDNWYNVTYSLSGNKETTKTSISLRLIKDKDHYKIAYIIPPWSEQKWDEDWKCNTKDIINVDYTSPFSFLDTFYRLYIKEYCIMPMDMAEKLTLLREKYCTRTFIEQFTQKEDESREDGTTGYDLLLGGFDFDKQWTDSFQIKAIDKFEFIICYQAAYKSKIRLKISIFSEKNHYKINKVEVL